VWESPAYGKKSLKITKGWSEFVIRRRKDNTVVKMGANNGLKIPKE
jgi:hypothetical protein